MNDPSSTELNYPPISRAAQSGLESIVADFADAMTTGADERYLSRLAGNWDVQVEMLADTDRPAMRGGGIDRSRLKGSCWLVSDGHYDFLPCANRLTLGFDAVKQRFVGSRIDTMSNHLWLYEGDIDDSGRTLTLYSQGPAPSARNERTIIREVMEFLGSDHRVLCRARKANDGTWVDVMKSDFRRQRVPAEGSQPTGLR